MMTPVLELASPDFPHFPRVPSLPSLPSLPGVVGLPPSRPPASLAPLARVLETAHTLPHLPHILVEVLSGRLTAPGGVLGALNADANLRGAVMAAVRLRHGAVPPLLETWIRLGNATMLSHVVDAALVLHLDRQPAPINSGQQARRLPHAFAVAGALVALARAEPDLDPVAAAAVGALHIVGEIALEQTLRLVAPRVAARLALGEITMAEVEVALRLNRFRAGAAVLTLQGLPAELAHAIARQPDPSGHGLATRLRQARQAAVLAGFPADGVDAGGPPPPREAVVAASEHVVRIERLQRVLCVR